MRSPIQDKQYHGYKIYHYTSTDYKKRANAAYLMCAFQIIVLGRSAEEAFRPFETVRPPFVAFRDASSGACYYKCTVGLLGMTDRSSTASRGWSARSS